MSHKNINDTSYLFQFVRNELPSEEMEFIRGAMKKDLFLQKVVEGIATEPKGEEIIDDLGAFLKKSQQVFRKALDKIMDLEPLANAEAEHSDAYMKAPRESSPNVLSIPQGKDVFIFDTTLRDGEEVSGRKLSVEDKVEIALRLEELGVDVIEAGFPISSPGDFKAVEMVAKVVQHSVVCSLSRAIEKDIFAAAESLSYAKRPRIHTGIGTSDAHIVYKLRSTPEKVLERAVAAVKYAKKYVEDVEFYAEDAGRTSNEYLALVVESVIKAGATVINIPDTTGYCLPEEYGAKIRYILEYVSGIHKVILSTHCHNDFGLATANSIAGLQNGARQVECTINGIGARAGNTSLEEVVMILRQHPDLQLDTRINSRLLSSVSQIVSEKMEMPVQPNKAIVGANAFAHSSGIHQDGVIKRRDIYEIINPLDVGVDSSKIVLTARSGRAALAYRAKILGFDLTKDELNMIYQQFLAVADYKKEVVDSDLSNIIEKSGKVKKWYPELNFVNY